jgi:molybdopterin-guanine dinucleotide biosynthesis protein A
VVRVRIVVSRARQNPTALETIHVASPDLLAGTLAALAVCEAPALAVVAAGTPLAPSGILELIAGMPARRGPRAVVRSRAGEILTEAVIWRADAEPPSDSLSAALREEGVLRVASACAPE